MHSLQVSVTWAGFHKISGLVWKITSDRGNDSLITTTNIEWFPQKCKTVNLLLNKYYRICIE